MQETEPTPPPFFKRPMFWGWTGTGVVVLTGLWAAFSKACESPNLVLPDCPTKWTYLVTSSPNELGDTLAGFAGALAFIWIIVTVAMQSLELAAQREELKLSRREFKRMAESQAKQVELLVVQGEIFADEQRQRNEERFESLLDEKLFSLILGFSESIHHGLSWSFSNDVFYDDYRSNGEVKHRYIGSRSDEKLTIDDSMTSIRRGLVGTHQELWDLLLESVDQSLPVRSDIIPDLVSKLKIIEEMTSSLSSSQQERLARMKLGEMIVNLEALYNEDSFWRSTEQ